jgi:Protein of unknown function (DUF2510)
MFRSSRSLVRPVRDPGSPVERLDVAPVSGWYPDPMGRFEYRYHNGQAWTADVASGGQRYVDPVSEPPGLRPPGLPGVPGPTSGPSPVRRAGNGIALAGMVCGIVGLVTGWVPFFGILGIVASIVGLSLSIPGLRRSSHTGERRSFAITGIITSALGIVVGVLGIIFTVAVFRAVQRFESPGANDSRVQSCTVEDGYLVARGELTNLSGRTRDYTVLVELDLGDRRRVAVDDVPAGESATFVARSERATYDDGDRGSCEIVDVNGPVPFGLDPDLLD